MWNILEVPPQPFGECTLCKRHNCGEYKDEEGKTRQKWVHTNLEMDKGGNLVIGYQCAQSMSDQLEITKRTVEKPILLTPNAEQVHDYIMKGITAAKGILPQGISSPPSVPIIADMNKDELKAYLKEKGVSFAPQLGEDKLREAAIAHVRGAKL